ncbi:MAG: BrnT family toxin, partial [Spirochaetales bacterium]|nr:BrnT family toxin [Spirochaetales bacterium]
DVKHSDSEERFFCFGKVNGMVCTVRFTLRDNKIRIIGAGYWRYGRQLYEEQNKL